MQMVHVVDDNARMLPLRLPDVSSRMWPAGAAALLWALAAGSVALWRLHFPRQEAVPGSTDSVAPSAPAGQGTAHVARALGHTTAPVAVPDAQRRFQLMGVIASGTGQGSALLMVDGQPAKAFVQGQVVADGWRLQSVARDAVRLSADGATLELALPARP